MALFKISKGPSANLDTQAKTEGYAWFTKDNGRFYIDVSSSERRPISSVYQFDLVNYDGAAGHTTNSAGFYLEASAEGTYTKILEAFNQNLIVQLKYYEYDTPEYYSIFKMSRKPDSGNIYFDAISDGIEYQIWCDPNNVWRRTAARMLNEDALGEVPAIQLITWEDGDDGSIQGDE